MHKILLQRLCIMCQTVQSHKGIVYHLVQSHQDYIVPVPLGTICTRFFSSKTWCFCIENDILLNFL